MENSGHSVSKSSTTVAAIINPAAAGTKIMLAGGVDIVISHAPVSGYGDMPDPAHRGFECFEELIEKYQPKLWVHGHVHKSYGTGFRREHCLGETRIVNACEKYEIEL